MRIENIVLTPDEFEEAIDWSKLVKKEKDNHLYNVLTLLGQQAKDEQKRSDARQAKDNEHQANISGGLASNVQREPVGIILRITGGGYY